MNRHIISSATFLDFKFRKKKERKAQRLVMSKVVLYTQPGVPNGDLVTMYLAVRSVFNPSKPSVFHGAHICTDVYTHPLLPRKLVLESMWM